MIAPAVMSRKVTCRRLRWPADSDRLLVELDESLFTTGSVRVGIDVSWDAVNFRSLPADTFTADDVGSPVVPRSITLGPFKGAAPQQNANIRKRSLSGVINRTQALTEFTALSNNVSNPLLVRVSVAPADGTPICGLRTNADDL